MHKQTSSSVYIFERVLKAYPFNYIYSWSMVMHLDTSLHFFNGIQMVLVRCTNWDSRGSGSKDIVIFYGRRKAVPLDFCSPSKLLRDTKRSKNKYFKFAGYSVFRRRVLFSFTQSEQWPLMLCNVLVNDTWKLTTLNEETFRRHKVRRLIRL